MRIIGLVLVGIGALALVFREASSIGRLVGVGDAANSSSSLIAGIILTVGLITLTLSTRETGD